ncbi:hypothetical protein BsWGS_00298 [Bradybaena similaris]
MCRRISGIYTVTVLTEGTYNPVVVIPAPACKINITEFSSSRNYIAVKTDKGQGIINSYWGLVQTGHHKGAGTRFVYDRESTSCRGSCIYSDGPTSEPIVVQILYYDKNPGISYEFTLPNNVPFTPFDGTFPKQNAALETFSLLPSHRHQQTSDPSHRRRHKQQRFHYDFASASNSSEFEGEYYTGSQFSRSEGRPEETSALQGHTGVKHAAGSPKTHPGTLDYTGSRYGTHTLGGRGMSYTHASEDSRSHVRDSDSAKGRHGGQRHRPGSPVLRKAASPHYVPPTDYRSAPSYAAQPRYQSFSLSTTYLNEDNNQQPDDSNYLKILNSQTSLDHREGFDNSQYSWKLSGLTECSQSCGGGFQKTNVLCVSVSGRTQVVVTPENCADSLRPRVQTVECNNSPCEPAWEAEEWSECSATCGSGTQTRTVECRQRFSSKLTLKVSADQCRQAEKPAIAQQCEKGLCTHWKVASWSECSRECGVGERRRSVRCVDEYDSQIPVGYCTGPAPAEVEPCNTQACNVRWWLSDWSRDCSELCGQGSRTRSALCLNNRGEVVSESLCDKRDLPNLEEECRNDAGCRGSWFSGAWGKCSAECGEGRRTRPVVCLRRSVGSLSLVRDEECDASVKPETDETCVNPACNAVWYTSPWSECSVTCGEGYRTREVRCIEDNRRPSLRCLSTPKPDSRDVCSLAQCTFRSQHHRTGRKNDLNSAFAGSSSIDVYVSRKGSAIGDFDSHSDEVIDDVVSENLREPARLPTIKISGHRTPGD